MGKQNSTMSAKCCGCCALALMAIASVLACIALSTDFWYTGIYKVTPYAGGDKFYAAATMGLEKACFYPTTVTADTKEPDGSTILGTKDWNCGKWKDTKLGGDTEDCKKAVDASLGSESSGSLEPPHSPQSACSSTAAPARTAAR